MHAHRSPSAQRPGPIPLFVHIAHAPAPPIHWAYRPPRRCENTTSGSDCFDPGRQNCLNPGSSRSAHPHTPSSETAGNVRRISCSGRNGAFVLAPRNASSWLLYPPHRRRGHGEYSAKHAERRALLSLLIRPSWCLLYLPGIWKITSGIAGSRVGLADERWGDVPTQRALDIICSYPLW